MDLVFVVDESRNMQAAIEWLPLLVNHLERRLVNAGVGSGQCINQYSAVGFARQTPDHGARTLRLWTGDVLVSANKFESLSFALASDHQGSLEDGYQAILHGVATVPFREEDRSKNHTEGGGGENYSKVIVLVTDEDRDVSPSGQRLDFDMMRDILQSGGFVLEAVVSNAVTASTVDGAALGMDWQGRAYFEMPGGGFLLTEERVGRLGDGAGETRRQYSELALSLNGSVWNIEKLSEDGVSQVMAWAFADSLSRQLTVRIQRSLLV